MKLLFLILIFSVSCLTQDAWKSKNFETWDTKDVQSILNKSDWVQKQSLKLYSGASLNFVAGTVLSNALSPGSTVSTGSVTAPIEMTITVRLRSSMAIRLGLIRQLQLETNVSGLSKSEKEAFLIKQNGLFECPACVENYVVTVSSFSEDDRQFDLIYNSFRNFRLEQLKNYISLQNDRGEKRELTHFVAPKVPGQEAQFIFKRNDDKGVPLLNKESKFFLFRLEPYAVNSPANFKIDVKPLIVGDKVDF